LNFFLKIKKSLLNFPSFWTKNKLEKTKKIEQNIWTPLSPKELLCDNWWCWWPKKWWPKMLISNRKFNDAKCDKLKVAMKNAIIKTLWQLKIWLPKNVSLARRFSRMTETTPNGYITRKKRKRKKDKLLCVALFRLILIRISYIKKKGPNKAN
jgi:hypothetical protein